MELKTEEDQIIVQGSVRNSLALSLCLLARSLTGGDFNLSSKIWIFLPSCTPTGEKCSQ